MYCDEFDEERQNHFGYNYLKKEDYVKSWIEKWCAVVEVLYSCFP